MDGIDSRPSAFGSVVGQMHAKKLLVNSLRNDKISRVYLFPGPYGIGKTTLASIFARALLCEDLDKNTSSPCNVCESCKTFLKGNNPFYTEVDAANNSTKEDMSNLMETLSFDFGSNRRVLLLDEVHRISKAGMDALLRVLERPVEEDGTIVLMCTTEINKMPLTLLSRCVRVPMVKPTNLDVLTKLKRICEANKVKYDTTALTSLAEWADGHFRDAENALEPLMLLGGISPKNVAVYTSYDEEAISEFLINLEDDFSKALESVESISAQYGVDSLQAGILKVLLKSLKYGLSGTSLDVSEACKNVYYKYGARLSRLLTFFTAKGRLADVYLLQSEITQAHYRIIKGDMDLSIPVSVSQSTGSFFGATGADKGTSSVGGSYLSDQRKLKALSRGKTVTKDSFDERISRDIGPEKAPDTLIIKR